jgi:hypothetical protein
VLPDGHYRNTFSDTPKFTDTNFNMPSGRDLSIRWNSSWTFKILDTNNWLAIHALNGFHGNLSVAAIAKFQICQYIDFSKEGIGANPILAIHKYCD